MRSASCGGDKMEEKDGVFLLSRFLMVAKPYSSGVIQQDFLC